MPFVQKKLSCFHGHVLPQMSFIRIPFIPITNIMPHAGLFTKILSLTWDSSSSHWFAEQGRLMSLEFNVWPSPYWLRITSSLPFTKFPLVTHTDALSPKELDCEREINLKYSVFHTKILLTVIVFFKKRGRRFLRGHFRPIYLLFQIPWTNSLGLKLQFMYHSFSMFATYWLKGVLEIQFSSQFSSMYCSILRFFQDVTSSLKKKDSINLSFFKKKVSITL